jgi:hydrogenase maturation factor
VTRATDIVASCSHTEGCITCGDEAVAMTVVSVDAESGLAVCAAEDEEPGEVETALVDPVAPGDRVLVHAGTAIANLQREAVAV